MGDNTALKELGQRREQECPKPLGTQWLAWHPDDMVIQPCPGDFLDGDPVCCLRHWQLAGGRARCPVVSDEVQVLVLVLGSRGWSQAPSWRSSAYWSGTQTAIELLLTFLSVKDSFVFQG